MWSLCSWVMNSASSSATATPMRARRRPSSRRPSPASISTRVRVVPLDASTRVALPELPLASEQKRSMRDAARRPYFSSSASTLTMRCASASAVGLPLPSSTVTVLVWPCVLTLTW